MKNYLLNIRQFRLLTLVLGFIFGNAVVAMAQILVSPATGAIGSTVVITGTNFTNVTEVRFNTALAVTYTVNSTTQITATVPAGATSGSVRVIANGTTLTSGSAFTPFVTWNGGNGDWHVAANWGNNEVPNQNTNVIINSGGTPSISTVAYCNDLTIQGEITLKAGANFSVSGLFINSGSYIQNDGKITITGIFSNQSSFSQNGGTIEFASNAANQVLPALTYHNLTISGSGVKTLQNNTTVEGVLTMVSSNLKTLDPSHILTLNGTIIGEDNTHSFIGKMMKTQQVLDTTPNDDFGNMGILFTNTGGGNWGNVTATRITGQAIVTPKGKSINRSWTITPTNPATNTAVVLTLTWLESETNGLTFPNGEAQAWRKEDNTEWLPVNGLKAIASNNNERSITVNTNTFSTWAISDQMNPLPVEMTSFTGKATTAGSVLNWVTASEKNVATFEVERSANGKEFETIGSVKAGGNSSNTLKYVFTDRNVTNKVSYYRLRMVDLDGTFEYSSIVTVTNAKAIEMSAVAYPNPFNESLNIRVGTAVSKAEVVLTTVDGKQVYRQVINEASPVTNLTLTNLPEMKAGFYLLNLIVDGKATVLKVAQQ